jgi:hypothetical protein
MTISRGAGGRWPLPERSLLGTVLGVPPLAAVGVAAALTALGVFVDLARIGTLGLIFTVCYLTGCVLAVAWVHRSGLFGPMVAPPLLLAAAVPVVVLLAGHPKPGAGVAERLLVIGAPLVNAFPMMAWTTGIAVGLGVARIAVQRTPEQAPPTVRSRPGSSGRGAGAAAREAGRTSASPRRS